jgi:hypothetical protein
VLDTQPGAHAIKQTRRIQRHFNRRGIIRHGKLRDIRYCTNIQHKNPQRQNIGQSNILFTSRFVVDITLALTVFMSFFAYSLGFFNAHRPATPVDIGSSSVTSVGRHSMRVAGRFVVSARVRVLSCAQPSVAAPSRHAFVRASIRRAPAQAQPVDVSPIEHLAIANAYQRSVFFVTSPFAHQNATEKTALRFNPRANPAVDPAPFSRWTLRDKAAQRRSPLR